MIFACLPVDTSALPVPEGVEIPRASVQHTLKQCQVCQQDIWVGPNQLATYDSLFGRGETPVLACYLCAIQVARQVTESGSFSLAMLNPNEALIPRRT